MVENNQAHTEPRLLWTRVAAFIALIHAVWYTLSVEAVDANVLTFDAFVIGCWALGGNGRAAVVDLVRAWKAK